MRAVTCTDARLELADLDALRPAKGHLLLKVLACGICGSDLHMRHHCDEMADLTAEMGYDGVMRREQSVVMGHEFSGEVLEAPRGSKGFKTGDVVVSLPMLRVGGAVEMIGLSERATGGYAEQVLVDAALTMPVPNGLDPQVAALTEPMAVALHAVRRGEVGTRDVAVVIGCGPVGLAVICMLKATGVRTVVAADLSPARRALAQRCGADVVVNPREESPYEVRSRGHLTTAADAFDLLTTSMDRLRSVPVVPWRRVWQLAELAGATTPKRPVIFECVGVPGMIQQVIAGAPLYSRVVVVGVCMEPDRIRPGVAINKEIDLRFVFAYLPHDFHDALHLLAEGKVDGAPLITGTVGLPGVEAAFDALADPEEHAKIIIDPASGATAPVTAG